MLFLSLLAPTAPDVLNMTDITVSESVAGIYLWPAEQRNGPIRLLLGCVILKGIIYFIWKSIIIHVYSLIFCTHIWSFHFLHTCESSGIILYILYIVQLVHVVVSVLVQKPLNRLILFLIAILITYMITYMTDCSLQNFHYV